MKQFGIMAGLALLSPLAGQVYESKTPVTVTASRLTTVLVSDARECAVIGPAEIAAMPALSVPDMMRWSGGVDLRSRGAAGVQSDFGLRGSSFEQVLVLVDGVRINDPQTGHHNGDIPVPLEDVERIEILHGPASALYGADGFGGVINVITKSGRSKDGAVRIKAGGFGTVSGSAGKSVRRGRWAGRFGAEGKGSTGYRDGTEYGIGSLFHRSFMEWADKTMDASLGWTGKDFGADAFYGPYPSRESTKALLASLRFGTKFRSVWSFHALAYARRHDDRFILDRNRPDWFLNTHRTYIAGAEAHVNRKNPNGSETVLGFETEWLDLESTALSNHRETRMSLFGELGYPVTEHTVLGAGFRIDAMRGLNPEFCPSFSVNRVLSRSLRWRASVGRAFRPPTFTEQFYVSPSSIGNPDLKPERGWCIESGFSWKNTKSFCDLTVFNRSERNRIDWVSSSSSGPWKAENIGRADVTGLSLASGRDLSDRVSARLSYMELIFDNDRRTDRHSKYGLYTLEHLASSTLLIRWTRRFRSGFFYSFKQRHPSETASLFDTRLSYGLGPVSLSLEGSNLLDSRFEDIPGIPAPGRSCMAGLEWRTPSL